MIGNRTPFCMSFIDCGSDLKDFFSNGRRLVGLLAPLLIKGHD